MVIVSVRVSVTVTVSLWRRERGQEACAPGGTVQGSAFRGAKKTETDLYRYFI